MTEIKNPDEIMAEYLLKGGKMLSKTCPVCHSPLFEYKGETFCVVCREEQAATVQKTENSDQILPPGSEGTNLHRGPVPPGGLEDEFAQTLRLLLIQAREEKDSTRILALMDAVKKGAEAYSLLLYGYGRRDNS